MQLPDTEYTYNKHKDFTYKCLSDSSLYSHFCVTMVILLLSSCLQKNK